MDILLPEIIINISAQNPHSLFYEAGRSNKHWHATLESQMRQREKQMIQTITSLTYSNPFNDEVAAWERFCQRLPIQFDQTNIIIEEIAIYHDEYIDGLKQSVANGHLEINRIDLWKLAKYGSLKIFDWLNDQGILFNPTYSVTCDFYIEAIIFDQVQVLEWIWAKNSDVLIADPSIANSAAEYGSLNCLKWLKAHDLGEWTSDTVTFAESFLQSVLENEIDLLDGDSPHMLKYSEKNHRDELINWLKENITQHEESE